MPATGMRAVSGARGAYGFRIEGAGAADRLLGDIAPDQPVLSVRQSLDDTPPPPRKVDESAAAVPLLPSGWLELERSPLAATYHVASPVGVEALVHPYLAPAAAIAASWQGWDPYHAAGVVVDGAVWAVSGARDAGKSTLVAALAHRGFAVMADDLLVIRERQALAGPRTIDLREGAAGRFGAARGIGVTGMRERWRLDIGPAPAAAPLAGWIYPTWGEGIAVTEVPLAERLMRPQRERAVTVGPPSPEHTMWLAGLRGVEFSRPRDWDALDASMDALLESLGRSDQSTESSE